MAGKFRRMFLAGAFLAVCTGIGAGCASPVEERAATGAGAMAVAAERTAESERDEILGLLAYALVEADWQSDDKPQPPRGHNIGTVLVLKDGSIAGHGLNSRFAENDTTQHGEVRAIQGWIASQKHAAGSDGYAEGASVYTTLEPCAMCAGMISLTKVGRVVFGQADPDYGGVFARLAYTDPCKWPTKPYPRLPAAVLPLPSEFRERIDAAYDAAKAKFKNVITEWLRSPEAHALYREAAERLGTFHVEHETNERVLAGARKYLADHSK